MYSIRILTKHYVEDHKHFTISYSKIDDAHFQQILRVNDDKKHNIELSLKSNFKISGFDILYQGK